MKRLRLRNKLLNFKSEIYRKTYIAQRNYCVTLIRKARQTFFGNSNTTDITDNKTFWQTAKDLFKGKIKTRWKITLIKKRWSAKKDKEKVMIEEVISDDYGILKTFNKYFFQI